MEGTGDVHKSVCTSSRGDMLVRVDAEKGSFLLLPNWHESQNSVLFKFSLDVGNLCAFITRETLLKEEWPSL
jgi:hypothetical protein